jgi:hypothetical protein
MSGTLAWVANRLATSLHVGDAVGAGVVDAHVDEVWEPSLTWSRAIATQVSQSAASMASRNFFEPLALVRSPTTRKDVSWWKGTEV